MYIYIYIYIYKFIYMYMYIYIYIGMELLLTVCSRLWVPWFDHPLHAVQLCVAPSLGLTRRIQNKTKRGLRRNPGNLLTLSKPNPYPKSVRTPAQKLRKIPTLWNPLVDSTAVLCSFLETWTQSLHLLVPTTRLKVPPSYKVTATGKFALLRYLSEFRFQVLTAITSDLS